MIKKILSIILLIVIVSCGGEKEGDSIEDNLIETPKLNEPTNQFICLDHENIIFKWTQSKEAKKSLIEVATDKQFVNKIKSVEIINKNNTTFSLAKSTTYYWRVKAVGEQSESEFSSMFQFYTQGDVIINNIPKTPKVVSPVIEASVTSDKIKLEWETSDDDLDDVLTFDVYFGTDSANLTLVSENQVSKIYIINTTSNTRYYWRIAAKDEHGAIALSSIWSFNVL